LALNDPDRNGDVRFLFITTTPVAHWIDEISPYMNKIAASDIFLSADLIAMVMDIAGEEWSL